MTCMRAISSAPGSVSLTQTHTPRGERDESERSGKAPTISSPVEGVTVKYVVAGIATTGTQALLFNALSVGLLLSPV